MKTKLTVIVDNIPQGDIKGEWGLSILVEYNDKKILVDAGASDLFAENMGKLGFDIDAVDYATLSHAHYDHSNGMIRFFKENKKAKFYLRDGVKENCYKKLLFFKKYIGIPRRILTDYADRIEFAPTIHRNSSKLSVLHHCSFPDETGRQTHYLFQQMHECRYCNQL